MISQHRENTPAPAKRQLYHMFRQALVEGEVQNFGELVFQISVDTFKWKIFLFFQTCWVLRWQSSVVIAGSVLAPLEHSLLFHSTPETNNL